MTTPEQTSLNVQDDEARAWLEHFVVEDDLQKLELLIGKFNIFDALSIVRHEIRHSNFLAFILDPAESHGQGQLFLKAILMDVLKKAPADLRPFSPIELDGTDLRGVEVKREWEHIDLLITCQQPPFVIVLENKIDSSEHSDQLNRYQTTIQDQYPNARPLYIYLTPNATEPSEGEWVSYSYSNIHEVLKRVRTTYQNAIGDDVLVFLDHYLSLIGTQFMVNPKIDELCQRIYKNHRRALDLIYEHRPASGVLAEAMTVLESDSRWNVFDKRRDIINFVPKAWLEWLPPVGVDRWGDDPRSWFIFRFALYEDEGRLDFYVEIDRMEDLAKRKEVVDLLIQNGDRFGFKHSGHKIKDSYTRVSGRERVLKWEIGDDPIPEKIREAVKKKLDEVFPKLEGIPASLKPLFNLPNPVS